MYGPSAIISSLIAKGLASFLDVNKKDMEANLFATKDGGINLQNVGIKEIRIRVSRKEGVTTSLLVSGSLEKVSISWSWSLRQKKLRKTQISIHGARIRGSFEQESEPDLTPTNNDNDSSTSSKKPGLFSTLWQEALQSITNSAVLQRTLEELANSIFFEITDTQFRLILPEDRSFRTSPSASFQPTALVAGLDRFTSTVEERDDGLFLTRPLNMKVKVESLSLNIEDLHGVSPILEPFAYALSIRRVSGVRFSTLSSGIEVIGRLQELHETEDGRVISSGLFIHASELTIDVMMKLVSICLGEISMDVGRDERYLAKRNTQEYTTFNSSAAIKSIRLLFTVLACIAVIAFLGSYSDASNIAKLVKAMIGMALLFAAVIVFASFLARYAIYTLHQSNIIYSQKSRQKNPAVFRFPFPSLTVRVPGSISATLTKLTILGRLDFDVLSFTTESLTGHGEGEESSGIGISAAGIRASYTSGRCLLNVDVFDELIHHRVRLLKPLMCSVVRFEDGILTTKLRSIYAEIRSTITRTDSKESHYESDELIHLIGSFVDSARQKLQTRGRRINQGIHHTVKTGINNIGEFTGLKNNNCVDDGLAYKEVARVHVANELHGHLTKLKLLAQMFEQIPVNNQRFRLRLFKNCFRGSDAVDYMLDCNLAQKRQDAAKLLRDLQTQFNLFEHVTREFNFRDDENALYRFVDAKRRRMWNEDSIPYRLSETVEEPVGARLIPFEVRLFVRDLLLRREIDESLSLAMGGAEFYAKPAKRAVASEFNLFSRTLETNLVSVQNTRIRFLVSPQLPQEIHGLEFSVDNLHASPEYSREDWYEQLGFVKQVDDSSESEETKTSTPYSLPYMYIAPFKLMLSWRGVVFAANETSLKIEPFLGNQRTTSNDLIKHFVIHVLGRAPGLLASVRILGVNVVEKTGVGTAIHVGAKFIPFGQYLALGGMALYDGVTAALDNGKLARDNPNDSYKPGDLLRGLAFAAEETTRTGARRRGKTVEQFYDEEDRVNVDPIDFAVGATASAASYLNENKARFAGATIASATMVAVAVATGPGAGFVIGLIVGAAAEGVIKKGERYFQKKKDDEISVKSSSTML